MMTSAAAGSKGPSTPATRSAAGDEHCDAGHNPAVASTPDRREVDVRTEAARPSGHDEAGREAHCTDGDGEPDVRLKPHPGRDEEPRACCCVFVRLSERLLDHINSSVDKRLG